MIEQELKDDQLHIFIKNKDFSYRIPLKKIEDLIDWKIGKNKFNTIQIKNVSKWALKIFTNNITTIENIKQFKGIMQQHCPNNTINWTETEKALNIQSHYSNLVSNSDKNKLSETEIIAKLKKKYKLD